jgi:hypothetical protein
VDPVELARVTATASYAAAATASFVGAQVADPEAVDPALIEQLFDQYAPIATEEALAWIDTVDPTALAGGGVLIKDLCLDPPYLCEQQTFCPWIVEGGARCWVNECGTGSCPYCPVFSNMIVRAWCSYGCMKGSDVVGGAFVLHFQPWKKTGLVCFGR